MKMRRREFSWAVGCAATLFVPVLVVGACNKSRPVPPDPGGMPAQTAGPAALTDRVHPPSGAPAMPIDHPAVLQPASATEASAEEKVALPDLSKRVAGTLKLTDKTKTKVAAGDTIFLVARSYSEGGAPGQVLAVKRLAAGTWPMTFELSGSDVMIEGAALSGKVVVTARVDKDGDAMTKLPGDVEGVSKPIAVPAKDVEVVLDTIRTEAAGPPAGGGMGAAHGGGMPPGHP